MGSDIGDDKSVHACQQQLGWETRSDLTVERLRFPHARCSQQQRMGRLATGSLNTFDDETEEDFVRHVEVSRINSARSIAFSINNFLPCVLLRDCSTVRPCLALIRPPHPSSVPWHFLSDWTASLQPPLPSLRFPLLCPARALRRLRRLHH